MIEMCVQRRVNVFFSLCLFAWLPSFSIGQMVDDAAPKDEILIQVRPRSEWRDGYRRLAQPGETGVLNTLQRTRMTWTHRDEKWEVRLGFQDVRTFGDPSGNASGYGNVAATESWGAWKPSANTRITAGRQHIAFDNERIVGAINWSQYGRFLDGLRVDQESAWGKSTAALTWDAPADLTRLMLYHVWVSETHRLSALYFGQFNSVTPDASVSTAGFTWTASPASRFSWLLEGYAQQFDAATPPAFMGVAEFRFQQPDGIRWLLGVDWLENDDRGKAFSPFLGTNHRHYGWMDHFYVGAPANGMTNAHVQSKIPLKLADLSAHLDLRYHRFYQSDAQTFLANEWDAVFVLKPQSYIQLSFGWSVMQSSDAMYAFQSRTVADSPWQHWGWVQMNFQPKILLK